MLLLCTRKRRCVGASKKHGVKEFLRVLKQGDQEAKNIKVEEKNANIYVDIRGTIVGNNCITCFFMQ